MAFTFPLNLLNALKGVGWVLLGMLWRLLGSFLQLLICTVLKSGMRDDELRRLKLRLNSMKL